MPYLSSSRTCLALAAFGVLAACHGKPAPDTAATPAARSGIRYSSGEEVVAAMRARYAGKWYRTLTFRQKTSQLRPNGTWSVQTWYEAIKLPGRLRIDFDPLSAGNGVLYARDSQYVVQSGKVARADAGINDLLLIGFDVYANDPARTVELLTRQGIDVGRVHMSTFQGRSMIVVGALAGDTRRKQIWIDAERLYFVRLVEPARDPTLLRDIRFVNYVRQGSAWIAPRVEIYEGGKLVFYEDYSDIRTDVGLDDDLFDSRKWRTAKHWLK